MAETVAVVLAGGVGFRMGYDMPKQFLPIAGKTCLEHSVAAFDKSSLVDRIIVMIEKSSIKRARKVLSHFSKVSRIEVGGENRNQTSYKSLGLISDPESKVLFHDAVRPLVTEEVISRCLEALDHYDAVGCIIDSVDTMVQVDGNGMISAAPDRAGLKRIQTPQGFRKEVIAEAYRKALEDPGFTATDDCGVVLKYSPKIPIKTVKGDENNIKLTYPSDIHLGNTLFQLKNM